MRYLWLILGPALLCANETQPVEIINAKHLGEVIATLASDEMGGRKAGTEYGKKAARFIATEFEKAGLAGYEEQTSFLQSFAVYNLEAVERTLLLDDVAIPSDDFVAIVRAASFKRDSLEGIEVQKVGPNDNLRQTLRQLFRAPTSTLVLIDPVHRPALGFLRRFANRGPQFELNAERALIVAVSESLSVERLKVVIENKVTPSALENVIGILPGKDKAEEIVMFSAHYDHLGTLPEVNGDNIANGADDDASGVAGIIALARYFKQSDNHRRTLMFVAFTAEEIGGFGSQFLAAKVDPEKIVAGINLEMIGKVSDFGPGNGYVTGFTLSDLGEIVQRNAQAMGTSIHPDPFKQNLFFRSDNINFARKGIPAHSFSTGPIDRDPYYHTVDDELATLDLEHMARFLRGLAVGVGSIVNGNDTPSRITGLN